MNQNLLDKLLRIEENSQILSFKYCDTDFAMYPLVRWELMSYALDEMTNSQSVDDTLKTYIFTKVIYIFKSFFHRAERSGPSPIIFFGSDISNINTREGYFNRLTELFANQYPDKTTLIEMSSKYNYKKPRTYPKVFVHDWTIIFAVLMSKFKRHKKCDLQAIEAFVSFLKDNFNYKFKDESSWNKVRRRLMFYSRVLPCLCQGYHKLFKKLKPKLVLVECGCYGNFHAVIIKVAKEMNVFTAEHQHGISSFNCPAYNYALGLNEEYKLYLPDIYLSYGKYFAEKCRLPIPILQIGNPYLSETIKKRSLSPKQSQLLYVSSCATPDRYVSDILYLQKVLEPLKISVIFRIHPSEKNRLNDVYLPLVNSGISIDTDDLYTSLNKSAFLVTDFSMVLFEATAFESTLFVVDSAGSRMHVDFKYFNVVSNMEEIVNKIIHKSYEQNKEQDFFAKHWMDNYKKFVDACLKKQDVYAR